NGNDRVKPAEVLLVSALVLVFAGVWAKWPEIKLSSKTLESYDLRNPNQPAWHNGIGLTISAERVRKGSQNKEVLAAHVNTSDFIAFRLSVNIDPANYPTMVDCPYERMSLTDQAGRQFHLVNQRLGEATGDARLRRTLETFDWSIVNNTFTRERRVEEGLLVFEKPDERSTSLTLHINLYHHPYKQIQLAFPFPAQEERATSSPHGNPGGS